MSIQLIQLTDTHLSSDEHALLFGINPRETLRQVVQEISKQNLTADYFILSGDIIQDDQPASYQVASQLTSELSPLYWVKGNHDLTEIAEDKFNGSHVRHEKIIVDDHWCVVLLNSLVPNQKHGELAAEQLQFLKSALEKYLDKYFVIVFHHPPLPVDCTWFDDIGLKNSEKLWELAEQFKSIKLMLCGHVHQATENSEHGVTVLTSPSTCVQFDLSKPTFALTDEQPGFRVVQLLEDGQFNTAIYRVGDS